MKPETSYWINESTESFEVAKILFDKNKYLESAFFCNLACEKILKAAIVEVASIIPPKIHILVRLAQLSNFDQQMNLSQIKLLNKLEVFQIESRYPQDRAKLYASTPVTVFQEILTETEAFLKWTKKQLP